MFNNGLSAVSPCCGYEILVNQYSLEINDHCAQAVTVGLWESSVSKYCTFTIKCCPFNIIFYFAGMYKFLSLCIQSLLLSE